MSEYEEYAMTDDTNDDAIHLTHAELIERSGFQHEVFDAIADDGYITTVTRVINPLVDRKLLRQPPVLMEHGGTIDPTAYLIASSIQHHPEKWPRTPEDGPMTSWNRSLAFVLANNGFDVWMAETRGSNDQNRRHIRDKALKTVLKGANNEKNMTRNENIREVLGAFDFWSFSQDDIIAHELKSHIDLVLNLTGSSRLSLFTFSLSTPTSLAFLSIRPDYAEKLQGYISMAPIISGQGTNLAVKLVFNGLCPLLPDRLGTLLTSDMLFTDPVREFILLLSKVKPLRYSVIKMLISLLMGSSAKYQTLMDLSVMGHMLRQLAFKEWKQLCQQMLTNKLQKYDYGPIKNKLLYNSTSPPVYDISHLKLREWIIVSAYNDALSTPQVIEHLINIVNPKPIAHVMVPGFNHMDLFTGFNNDIYVNLPILRYLERVSYSPDYEAAGSRSFDIQTILSNGFDPFKDLGIAIPGVEDIANYTRSSNQKSPFPQMPRPEKVMGDLQRNINTVWRQYNPVELFQRFGRLNRRKGQTKQGY